MPSFHMFMTTLVIIPVLISFLSFNTKAAPEYRYHFCSNTTTFAPNSTYQSNLNLLLSSLTSNATLDTGFYNTTVGRDPRTAVYGSFLCRGDVIPNDCQNCAATAAKEVTQQFCPMGKIAIIWYDQCMLRFSNVSFFGNMEEVPTIILVNRLNIPEPERFSEVLDNTMNKLVAEAADTPSGAKKYATREANFSGLQTLYSLVQCTPDISSSDCNRCLTRAAALLPSCCARQQGANILYSSCNLRYEVYPFYRIQAAAPSPTPPSTTGARGNGNISPTIIIAICAPIAVVLSLFSVWCYWQRRRVKDKYNAIRNDQSAGNEITAVESLQYDLGTIQAATSNFSDDNKLGEGGFGAVYKGMLSNGQEIAVKRLSRSSTQGGEEFKNEVLLVAKLQHRNLARILGFCLEGEEKILVYEFVHNKSLDNFLFDHPEDQAPLDWSRRYKIIGGIARGILYLHEDSRLRIIHRDLKSSNILLDREMNPKISDFGMAKLCGVDQTHGNTSRIVGTYGYMSPEYAFYGQFSVKSDVYSFGVLIMEIITGKKNTSFLDSGNSQDLLSHAWKNWSDGTPLELLDQRLRDSYTANEVIRCIHIGLLCVQEDPADRPTMASIVLMLSSYSVTLSLPKKPAFFPHSGTGGNMPSIIPESEKSTSNTPCTPNEMSLSEIYPR